MTSPLFARDKDKNLSNQRKRGLRFEVAARVFFDPLHLSVQDRIEDGEKRRQTIGQIDGRAVVLRAHAFMEERPLDEPIEVIRIISACPATRKERKRFNIFPHLKEGDFRGSRDPVQFSLQRRANALPPRA